jgi:tRNA U34 5-methylaminomethyl-2-thiouridine-forming methyltransferase MnmC
LERQIIITEDGSTTIYLPEWNEHYHSKFGAIQESRHVFIQKGLSLFSNQKISVLEIGFGTGLNCLLTFLEAEQGKLEIEYVGVEAYPISREEVEGLNYISVLKNEKLTVIFEELHLSPWEVKNKISSNFSLEKREQFFQEINDMNRFDLIYFDAFGPQVQPELWTEVPFKKMFDTLKSGGVLVTYSARGSVRRAMQSAGFAVERLEGPPGKREMLRAIKPNQPCDK